jgi:hypothetical protein
MCHMKFESAKEDFMTSGVTYHPVQYDIFIYSV